ncbi:hypothetical protein H6F96_24565 [Microcoleus sp. FACHB-53]|nr:hypothetical protein [Microcoleus sp. FACHB-53]
MAVGRNRWVACVVPANRERWHPHPRSSCGQRKQGGENIYHSSPLK